MRKAGGVKEASSQQKLAVTLFGYANRAVRILSESCSVLATRYRHRVLQRCAGRFWQYRFQSLTIHARDLMNTSYYSSTDMLVLA